MFEKTLFLWNFYVKRCWISCFCDGLVFADFIKQKFIKTAWLIAYYYNKKLVGLFDSSKDCYDFANGLLFLIRPIFEFLRFKNGILEIGIMSRRTVLQLKDDLSGSFYPRGRPTVTASSDHCFCTCHPFVRRSVPTFQNKSNFKRKQCSLLARLWVWLSGSLMTPVLWLEFLEYQ